MENPFENYFEKLHAAQQGDNCHALAGSPCKAPATGTPNRQPVTEAVRKKGPDAGGIIDRMGLAVDSDPSGQENRSDSISFGTSRNIRIPSVSHPDSTVPIASRASAGKNGPDAGKFIDRMGLADDYDNVHAQRDDRDVSYGASLTGTVNDKTGQVADALKDKAAYGMRLSADEHLARYENPLGNLLKERIESGLGKSGAEHQDESAYLLMNRGLGALQHDAVARTLTLPLSGTVNGKSKWNLTKNAFHNEFVTKPAAAFYSAAGMTRDAAGAVLPENAVDETAYRHIEDERAHYQRQSDAYEKNTMPFTEILDPDDAEKTVDNLGQYFYETLGSTVPYAALMVVNPVTGKLAPWALRLLANLMYGTAESHSRIRQASGQSDYGRAFASGAFHAAVRELPFIRNRVDPEATGTWADVAMRLFTAMLDRAAYERVVEKGDYDTYKE